MISRYLPIRPLRGALILIGVLCVAAATPLMGQQAADSSRAVPVFQARAHFSNTVPMGPQASPRFQAVEPRLAPSPAAQNAAVLQEGRQHTIVISTLALVLAVIIIVLVVAR